MLIRRPSQLFFFDEKRFLSDLESDNPVQVFRDAINAARAHFDNRFIEGENVRTLVQERAKFMDRILGYAWHRFEWDASIALIAVGGYGRGELLPHSDIDLLILMKRNYSKKFQRNIEQFLTFLWDIQLQIGHSVRSLAQCVQQAKADITVATNLMECRTIAGDEQLRRIMLEKTGPNRIWPSAAFFCAKRDEQMERHNQHGNTEYNLEPNVKEAPGGLRDIQVINWVAKRHFMVESVEELVEVGFLTEEDYRILRQGEKTLWRVRYGLHLLAGRAEERLLFDYQRILAEQFGFQDNEERLAVEQFMQRYYRTVLMMRELNDVLLQYLDEVILREDKARLICIINERFQVRDNLIETAHENVFPETPSALLEIFLWLGRDETLTGIRAATIQQIRYYRSLINDEFRANPENRSLFMQLLKAPHKLSLQLQRMTRYGVLGKYLPEFGKIIGQMQHDLFHIYPVDAHTLQVIKNIRRFGKPDAAKKFPIASRIYKITQKPELLLVAGLYHDIAKGRGGNHSKLGAIEVEKFCQRHHLSHQATELLKWLVENHLAMSTTSQREDLSNPEVINKFARFVGDQLHLDYLYTLTVADINATNPTLWTGWKASLLSELYLETRMALQRGLENPAGRKEWIDDCKYTALLQLQSYGIDKPQTLEIWDNVSDEFFLRGKAEDIVKFTRAIADNKDPRDPVILIQDAGVEKPVASQVFIHTEGMGNLFPITAVVFDQLRLTVQDARLHTSQSGATFDTYYVLDDNLKPISNPHTIEEIKRVLRKALRHPDSVSTSWKRRTSRQLRHFTMSTTATLTNQDGVTRLEVVTPDRPGLLAHIGRIFKRFDLNLQSAKISTLGERVEDVFYLTDNELRPLTDNIVCNGLVETICYELDRRNKGDLSNEPLSQMNF